MQCDGFEFWRTKLKSGRHILAPMVEQSELPWRLLSRKYNTEVCYTPMIYANVFVRDATYRREMLLTCADDQPLIVQFCGNDPQLLADAAKHAQSVCQAVDINFGCPQNIARRGYYGAYLQDDWPLVRDLVSTCSAQLTVPVTCKIRVFDSVHKTVQYAKMLEDAGCKLLAVHGRTIKQKGVLTGLASWEHIKAVKEHVRIPVFANGNIQMPADVAKCFEYTSADGVMVAEGNLHNPAIFAGKHPDVCDVADDYLQLARDYPCALSSSRGHLFKLFHHFIQQHIELRPLLANAHNLDELQLFVHCARRLSSPDKQLHALGNYVVPSNLVLPYWLCQPYYRKSSPTEDEPSGDVDENGAPDVARPRAAKATDHGTDRKRLLQLLADCPDLELSLNKLKRLRRCPAKRLVPKPPVERLQPCQFCDTNIVSLKCAHVMCRPCCRAKCRSELVTCESHHYHYGKAAARAKPAVELDAEATCEQVATAQVLAVTDVDAANGGSGRCEPGAEGGDASLRLAPDKLASDALT